MEIDIVYNGELKWKGTLKSHRLKDKDRGYQLNVSASSVSCLISATMVLRMV